MSLSTAATIHQIDREREKPLIAFWQENGTSVCAYVNKVREKKSIENPAKSVYQTKRIAKL